MRYFIAACAPLNCPKLDEQLKQLKELRYDGPYEEIQNQASYANPPLLLILTSLPTPAGYSRALEIHGQLSSVAVFWTYYSTKGWSLQGWKGSTKARNFVLALRDFLSKEYIFNDDSHDHAKASSLKTATAPKSRRASISVIDVAKIQPSENVPEGKLGSAVATRRNSALGIYTLRTLSQEGE